MKRYHMIQSAFLSVLMALMMTDVCVPPAAAVSIPEPPPVNEVAGLIRRPENACNAADVYLEAERLFREKDAQKPAEQRLPLAPDSAILALVEKGLACERCEFPYSSDMTLPPYEQMIPMMALYRAAARTWRIQGDDALQRKAYAEAADRYNKAAWLGLQLHEEPGITIIQDMISFSCMQEGIEGLGDVFIATGETEKAAICERFLENRARYIDSLKPFVNSILRGPKHPKGGLTENFKAVALLYPSVTYLPIKVEIVLATAEIYAFHRKNPDAEKTCRLVLDAALKDSDTRIRKMAAWALGWDIADHVDLMNDQTGELDPALLEQTP